MKAWELVARGWCQGAYAQDTSGVSAPWDSPYALRFCAIGAMYKAGHRDGRILEERIGGSVFDWNDAPERTQAEVVAVLKELDL